MSPQLTLEPARWVAGCWVLPVCAQAFQRGGWWAWGEKHAWAVVLGDGGGGVRAWRVEGEALAVEELCALVPGARAAIDEFTRAWTTAANEPG